AILFGCGDFVYGGIGHGFFLALRGRQLEGWAFLRLGSNDVGTHPIQRSGALLLLRGDPGRGTRSDVLAGALPPLS
ncbi:MAG: hypothetical protein K8R38_00265, partial [Verrucomicrobia bacterium]|nr:hypothetical protein [Verrucomicrobiota bacterium]